MSSTARISWGHREDEGYTTPYLPEQRGLLSEAVPALCGNPATLQPASQATADEKPPTTPVRPHTAMRAAVAALTQPGWPDLNALQTESTLRNFSETNCRHPCGSLGLSPRKQGLTYSAVQCLYYVKPPLYKRKNPAVVQKIPTLSNRCFLPLGYLVISDSVSCSLYFNDRAQQARSRQQPDSAGQTISPAKRCECWGVMRKAEGMSRWVALGLF